MCIVSVYLFIYSYLQCTWLFLLHISSSFLVHNCYIFSSSAASVINKFSECSVTQYVLKNSGFRLSAILHFVGRRINHGTTGRKGLQLIRLCHRRLKLRTDGGQSRVRELAWVHRPNCSNFFENEPIVTQF